MLGKRSLKKWGLSEGPQAGLGPLGGGVVSTEQGPECGDTSYVVCACD